MANTYTYAQSPNHGGPLAATGKIVVSGGTAVAGTVEIGFHPSLLIAIKDDGTLPTPTDIIFVWAPGWGTNNWLLIGVQSVFATAANPFALYTGSDDVSGEKLGFTIAPTNVLDADDTVLYWIAFP